MNSPLHLEQHFVIEVSLKATRAEVVSRDFGVSATPMVVQSDDDPLLWAIQLHVEIKESATEALPPYTGSITFFGNFRVSPLVPDDRRKKMVATNGSSILYGAVRELVANLTARGPHPMITLPSISFVPTDLEMTGAKKTPRSQSVKPAKRKKPGRV